MKKRSAGIAVGILVVLAGLAALLWARDDGPAPGGAASQSAKSDAQPTAVKPELRPEARALDAAAKAEEPRDEAPDAGRAAPSPPALAEPADALPPRMTASAAAEDSSGAGSTAQKATANEPRASLGKDEIRAAVRAVVPRIKECYESALGRDPSLAGKVLVSFEIEARDGKGKVISGEVPDSDTRSPFFEACVLERVAGAEFPAPEGDGKVKVTYPFNFDPGGGFGGGDAPTGVP